MTILERIKYTAELVEFVCLGILAMIATWIWKKRNWNRLKNMPKDYEYLVVRLKAMEYYFGNPIGKLLYHGFNDEDYQSIMMYYGLGLEGKEYTE